MCAIFHFPAKILFLKFYVTLNYSSFQYVKVSF